MAAQQTPSAQTPTGSMGDRIASLVQGAGRIDRGRWWLEGAGATGYSGESRPLVALGARVGSSVTTGSPLSLHLAAAGDYDNALLFGRQSSLGAESRLAWNAGYTALYISAAGDRAWMPGEAGERTRSIGLGAARAIGNLLVALEVGDRHAQSPGSRGSFRQITTVDTVWNDTLQAFFPVQHTTTIGDSGTAGRSVSWRELNLRAQWWRSRVALSAQGGLRFVAAGGGARVGWGNVEASYLLTPRLALVTLAGWQPVAPLLRDDRTRFLALGIRLAPSVLQHPRSPLGVSPAPVSLVIGPAEGGEHVVRVRAPHARRVELSGDFTEWKPVVLESSGEGDGTWSARLPITPGTHRLAVRIDGGRWTAPPGLPRLADDFGGESGVVMVK